MSQGPTFQTTVVTTVSGSFWGGCGSFQLASDSAIRENIRSFIEQLVKFYGNIGSVNSGHMWTARAKVPNPAKEPQSA
jgi:hypothetical protein